MLYKVTLYGEVAREEGEPFTQDPERVEEFTEVIIVDSDLLPDNKQVVGELYLHRTDEALDFYRAMAQSALDDPMVDPPCIIIEPLKIIKL